MIDKLASQGSDAALARFKVANAPPGILDRLKSFGAGQWGAAKDLVGNLRGGLGGEYHPSFQGNLASNPAAAPLNRAAHRQMAMGNLKTLAPSLAIMGGGYLLHRHNQAKRDEEARQRSMMMQQGYGPGGM